MASPIARDPRIKNEIKTRLEDHLYEPFYDRMTKVLNTLIVRNAVVSGYAHMSFTYKGVFYTYEDPRNRAPLRRNRLHVEFHAAMDEYLEDMDQVERIEKPLVMGFIVKVLNNCDDLFDLLKIFPESVHKPIKMALGTAFHTAGKELSPEQIKGFVEAEQASIDYMKRRMAINLLY